MHCKNNQAIGVFDSGIGGLTIAQCIKQQLPLENLIYFADNKFAPYGEQSTQVIIDRVNHIADYFIEQQVKAIVIACNTATVVAIDQLRQRISIPVIGVEPAIKPAAFASKTKKVGILVTQATANNQRFLALIAQHSHNADVYIQPCPGLVEQIEAGQINSVKTQQLLAEFLLPLLTKGIDKLVLGCTHYPMLEQQIKQLVGDKVTLIDTAFPVAKQLHNQLEKFNLLSTQTLVTEQRLTSDQWLTSQDLRVMNNLWHSYPWQYLCLPQ
jgi:glutamate racemase